jgi:hypothetical protein
VECLLPEESPRPKKGNPSEADSQHRKDKKAIKEMGKNHSRFFDRLFVFSRVTNKYYNSGHHELKV